MHKHRMENRWIFQIYYFHITYRKRLSGVIVQTSMVSYKVVAEAALAVMAVIRVAAEAALAAMEAIRHHTLALEAAASAETAVTEEIPAAVVVAASAAMEETAINTVAVVEDSSVLAEQPLEIMVDAAADSFPMEVPPIATSQEMVETVAF